MNKKTHTKYNGTPESLELKYHRWIKFGKRLNKAWFVTLKLLIVMWSKQLLL